MGERRERQAGKVCVCVCVCERERDRKREREREREREKGWGVAYRSKNQISKKREGLPGLPVVTNFYIYIFIYIYIYIKRERERERYGKTDRTDKQKGWR